MGPELEGKGRGEVGILELVSAVCEGSMWTPCFLGTWCICRSQVLEYLLTSHKSDEYIYRDVDTQDLSVSVHPTLNRFT